MPVVACPGCGKQYTLPATAAGQIAKCACGKRFKLSGAAPSSSKSAMATAAPAAKRASGESASSGGGVAKSSAVQAFAAAATATKVAAVKTAPNVAGASARSAAVASRSSALAADDDFWNEGLKPAAKLKEPEAVPVSAAASGLVTKSAFGALPANSAEPKKKKKAKKRVAWGFDWGKVVGGLASFVLFGGITAALAMSTGRISIYLAFLAVAGLFTALTGLMGEEGIW
jgi:hypothetical protein